MRSSSQVSEAVLANRKLSAFEQCLAQGALGTASWREKRDKFRGDSEVRAHYSLQSRRGTPFLKCTPACPPPRLAPASDSPAPARVVASSRRSLLERVGILPPGAAANLCVRASVCACLSGHACMQERACGRKRVAIATACWRVLCGIRDLHTARRKRGSRAALRAQIGTLERAYQIVQMLNTPSQQFNVLGLIAPGAGWAGGLAPASQICTRAGLTPCQICARAGRTPDPCTSPVEHHCMCAGMREHMRPQTVRRVSAVWRRSAAMT